jgi:HEAT repeat protein
MQKKEQEEWLTKRESVDQCDVEALIENLASKDGILRVKSRQELVSMEDKAIQPLTDAMSSKDEYVRWEATKALGMIASNIASKESSEKVYHNALLRLVEALEDKNFDVRWLAAEALISIGKASIRPVLEALIQNPDSLILREGAHHVFHDLMVKRVLREKLVKVIKALEDINSPVEVPFIAKSVLDSL